MRKEVTVWNLYPIILQRSYLEIYNGKGLWLIVWSNFRDSPVIMGRNKCKYNQTFITCLHYDKCPILLLAF